MPVIDCPPTQPAIVSEAPGAHLSEAQTEISALMVPQGGSMIFGENFPATQPAAEAPREKLTRDELYALGAAIAKSEWKQIVRWDLLPPDERERVTMRLKHAFGVEPGVPCTVRFERAYFFPRERRLVMFSSDGEHLGQLGVDKDTGELASFHESSEYQRHNNFERAISAVCRERWADLRSIARSYSEDIEHPKREEVLAALKESLKIRPDVKVRLSLSIRDIEPGSGAAELLRVSLTLPHEWQGNKIAEFSMRSDSARGEVLLYRGHDQTVIRQEASTR